MKYKKFHKLIEEEYAEQKQSAYEGLKEDLNLPDDPVPAKRTHARDFFKKPYRLISCFAAAMVAVCLAIVLPLTLNSTPTPTERYCSTEDCLQIEIDYCLKEYSERNNLSLLYIDWYDLAYEVQTKLFVNINDNSDIIYFQEIIVNGNNGLQTTLCVTDKDTKVYELEMIRNVCSNIIIIDSIQVYWGARDRSFVYVAFDYGMYRYYIELVCYLEVPGIVESDIVELVESMIPNN